MEDQIVDFIVSMNERGSVLRLHVYVLEEGNHILEMRDFSHRLFGLDVDGLGL
jgi:hypothetical protein